MRVADQLFVAIDYRLTLDNGEEADRSAEGRPLGFVVGAGQIIPGLEQALLGRTAGYRGRVTVEPEHAYGEVDERLFQDIPRDRFPAGAEIAPGACFQARGPRGPVALTVARVNADDTVTVDLNHPLAGKRLTFDVAIVEVREPRPGELPSPVSGCGCGSGPAADCGPGSCGPAGCGSGCSCG